MAKSVLVVGGAPHIQRLVQVNLERQGYEVAMARTLAEARLRIDARCPDLLVVDVLMPPDALDFLRELMRDPAARPPCAGSRTTTRTTTRRRNDTGPAVASRALQPSIPVRLYS